MNQYLLIESRDPFSSSSVAEHAELAIRLKRSGNGVAVFLLQNGVLPLRPNAQHAMVERLLDARVEVFADEFALRERGVSVQELAPGIRPAAIDLIIDRMLAGWSALWH